MKKYVYCCAIFCIAVCAYPQGLLQADENEAVQSDTVTQETTIEAETLSEIIPAKIAEVQGAMAEIRIDELIKDGLFKNKALINQQALLLPEGRRLNIQEKYRMNYVSPILLNFIIGFGSGNFINGDTTGGFVHLAIDSSALLTGLIAGLMFQKYSWTLFRMLPGESTIDQIEALSKKIQISGYTAIIAYSIFAVDKLASIISVSVHTSKYNRTLKEALTPAKAEVSIYTVPIIAPNQFGLALNINY